MDGVFCTMGGRLSIKVDSAVVSDSFSSAPHEIFHMPELLLFADNDDDDKGCDGGGRGGLSAPLRLWILFRVVALLVLPEVAEDCRVVVVVTLGEAVDEGMELEE